MGFTGTERYELRRRLGQGGMGTVYAVFDQRRQREVALKVLNDPEAGSLYRFKREFRAVADLRHPNLVRLYDLGVLPEGEFFFTMELVPGADLQVWLERRRQEARRTLQVGSGPAEHRQVGSGQGEEAGLFDPGETAPLPPEDAPEETVAWQPATAGVLEASGPALDLAPEIARVLGEVAEGLHYLHACRLVHRDLKPSNVMIDAEGRARLLDFGILRDLDREGLTLSGAVGTPLYMSPEQVGGDPVGPPADLYSLGCILYQLLCGRPPFQGRAAQVLMRHIRERPQAPSELGLCDPRLESLCLALLEKDPAARPPIGQVCEALWEVAGGPPGGASSTRIQPPRQAAELLGREAELARLEAAFTATQRGGAQVVLIAGESGSGKSALAGALAQRLEGRTIPWFGGCFEREHVPYKAFDAIVDAVAVELARRGAEGAALLPDGAGALARVFPVLREVEAVSQLAPETPLRDAQAERARAGRAFFELLTNLGGGQPPLLIVDDLQRSDIESLEVLRWLGLPEAPPCLLVGTYRSEEVDADHPLRETLSMPHVRALELPPLEREAVVELAQACAGTSLSDAKLRRLIEDAQGNPFLVVELARAAERLGQDVLPSVTQLVSERLAGLGEVATLVVEVAAVAGGRAGFQLLAEAAQVGPAQLADALDELLRVQLLREVQGHHGDDAYDLIHDRLRRAIYERIEPVRRRALHLDLAERLTATGDMGRAVVHFRLSGEAARAREAALAAAASAEAQLAFDRAAELYRLALSPEEGIAVEALAPDAERRIQISLAGALAKAGRHGEAAQAFGLAAESAPPEEARELLLEAATRWITSGDTRAGLDGFDRLLRGVGHRMDRSFLAIAFGIVWRFLLLVVGWWLRDLWPRLFGQCPTGEPSPEEDYRLRLYDRVHMALAVTRPMEAARFGLIHALRSRRYGQGQHQGRARIGYALFLSGALGWVGARRAHHHLEIGEALCSDARDAQGLLSATVSRAFLALLRGHWEQVRHVSEAAELLARKAGLHGEPALLLVENIRLAAEMLRGDPDTVVRVAQRYVEGARARGNRWGLAWPLSMQGSVLLWQGKREEGGRALEEALAVAPAEPLTVLRVHVEILALGLELCDDRCDEGLAKLADLDRRWRCGGLVASSLENTAYRLFLARLRLAKSVETDTVSSCRLRAGLDALLPVPSSVREEMLRLRAAVAFHSGRHAKAHRLLSHSLRLAEGNDNRLSQGVGRLARARVREALGWPGAGLDRERGEALLAEIGCTDSYLVRTEGWLK